MSPWLLLPCADSERNSVSLPAGYLPASLQSNIGLSLHYLHSRKLLPVRHRESYPLHAWQHLPKHWNDGYSTDSMPRRLLSDSSWSNILHDLPNWGLLPSGLSCAHALPTWYLQRCDRGRIRYRLQGLPCQLHLRNLRFDFLQ